MKVHKHFLYLISLCTLLGAISCQVVAQEKRAVKPPPSAQLNYSIRADVHGLVLDGSGQIDWALREGQYQLLFETRTALTGVLLSEKSEGGLDRYGLAPNS